MSWLSAKNLNRSFQSFGHHWAIALLAIIVIASGLSPSLAANQTSTSPRSHTIAELASAEFFNEEVSYDEVIVTVGENSDYIFKTGATETVISRNNRNTTLVYEVKANESIASVARDFGISPDTLRYANKLTGNGLSAGQKIKIPPVDGIYIAVAKNDTLSTIGRKYRVSVDDIGKYNALDTSQPIFAGQEILIPGVVAPKSPSTSTPIAGGQASLSRGNVANTISPDAPGQFIWPTQTPTRFISQGYRGSHRALDLNRLNGWGIYASAAGSVNITSLRYGYGNHIDLNHGNGWTTRYAHLSEFRVKDGDYVQQGQLIGIMGSTGRSTGPHLHFEIRFNDNPVNPLSYLPR